MKAAIISQGSTSSKWTYDAMKKYFDTVDNIDIKKIQVIMNGKDVEILYDGKNLEKYDCIYVKGSFRYASLARAITSVLSDDTYMPLSAESFSIGHDKLLTHLALQKSKVASPKTYLAAGLSSLKGVLEGVSYPVVIKFPAGTQGKGVMFAESFSSASSMLDALESLKQPVIIQEYIETGGVDIRAIVVGDKVVAAMKRKAEKGEKRANIHAGGSGESYLPSPLVKDLATDTAKALGVDVCAVDILEGPKGPVVLEVNLSPGLQGITEVTKIDVAEKVAKMLFDKTQEFKSKRTQKGTKTVLKELGINDLSSKIITNLDFRLGKIVLPEVVTKKTKLTEKDEVEIEVGEGKLNIKKFA